MSEFKNKNWQLLIDKQNESGISKRRFCLEHELPYQTFLYHRKRLWSEQVSLVPVLIHKQSAHASFSCNGKSIEVPEDVSVDFLSKLLKASEL